MTKYRTYHSLAPKKLNRHYVKLVTFLSTHLYGNRYRKDAEKRSENDAN